MADIVAVPVEEEFSSAVGEQSPLMESPNEASAQPTDTSGDPEDPADPPQSTSNGTVQHSADVAEQNEDRTWEIRANGDDLLSRLSWTPEFAKKFLNERVTNSYSPPFMDCRLCFGLKAILSKFSEITLKIIFYSIVPVIFFWLDLLLDVNLIIRTWNRSFWYFVMTLVFVVLPGLVQSLLFVMMNRISIKTFRNWSWRTWFSVCFFSPLVRYHDIRKKGIKCKQLTTSQSNYSEALKAYKLMLEAVILSKYLRLIEVFLEAAPQSVIQLYFIADGKTHPTDSTDAPSILQLYFFTDDKTLLADWFRLVQLIVVVVRPVMFSLNLAFYYVVRDKGDLQKLDSETVDWIKFLGNLVPNAGIMIARQMFFVHIALWSGWFLAFFVSLHWIAMMFFLIFRQRCYGDRKGWANPLELMLLAAMHIFVFVRLEIETSVNKFNFRIYCVICFLECFLWFLYFATAGVSALCISLVLFYFILMLKEEYKLQSDQEEVAEDRRKALEFYELIDMKHF